MDHPEFRTLIENADDALAQGDFTRLMEFYADDADADSLWTIHEGVRFLVNESSRITLLGLHPVG